MPTPTPRTPICIARGNLADLEANKGDIEEGEICYAFDTGLTYVKKGTDLVQVGTDVVWDNIPGMPVANEYDIMQAISGKWVGANQLNGGNFLWLFLLPLCAYLTQV